MNKNDVIRAVSKKTNFTIDNSAIAVNAVYEALHEALCKEEKLIIHGIGTFTPSERSARTGRDPRTGEPIEIPSKKIYKFKLSQAVSDKING